LPCFSTGLVAQALPDHPEVACYAIRLGALYGFGSLVRIIETPMVGKAKNVALSPLKPPKSWRLRAAYAAQNVF
jgi:hypothetical protein